MNDALGLGMSRCATRSHFSRALGRAQPPTIAAAKASTKTHDGALDASLPAVEVALQCSPARVSRRTWPMLLGFNGFNGWVFYVVCRTKVKRFLT